MKPAPFDYLAPESLDSVLEVMAEHGYDAKLVAGGQSLIPAMNFRLVQPTMLVDLNKLTDLAYIKIADSGKLLIGGLTRHYQLEKSLLVKQHAPLIFEAMPEIAHPQIRNRGTIGGSLAHADPAAELPVLMVALDARIRVKNQERERWVKASEFFQGIFTTNLADDEVIIEIEVPPMQSGTGWSFIEFARRQGDYALLGLAALITLDQDGICRQARLVYLNAGDKPVEGSVAAALLVGEKPTEQIVVELADRVVDELSPMGNIHATVPYLEHLARVLTKRAIQRALSRTNEIVAPQ